MSCTRRPAWQARSREEGAENLNGKAANPMRRDHSAILVGYPQHDSLLARFGLRQNEGNEKFRISGDGLGPARLCGASFRP